MNASRLRAVMVLIMAIFALAIANRQTGAAEASESSAVSIKEWEIQWFADSNKSERPPSLTGPWITADISEPETSIPKGYDGAWVHVAVPPTADWQTPGLLISQLYGLDISVYEDGGLLYRSSRDFSFDRNMLLLALAPKTEPSDLYIRIESMDRAGPSSAVRIGDFYELSETFIREELPSVLLGASIAFMGLLMLLVSGYLNVQQRRAWVSLSLIALTASVMIVTYSTLPFIYFEEFGKGLQFAFDLSMLTVFPALHFYVASVFEGKLAFFKRFGRWFAGYSVLGFLVLILNEMIGDAFFFYYKLFTFWLLAPLILVHLLLVLGHSVVQSVRGNRNSTIMGLGFLALALTGVADLLKIFASETMPLIYLWKFGIVLLIVSLIVVLARKISADHRRLLSYSKELELFNHQLQRAEKMKIISDLAASIAHEVRNPLQVTRGFLQLIAGRSDEASKPHFEMAINELDRASGIITDFLTFAKPEMDTVVALDIQQELGKIESIISPLAAYHGTVLEVRIPDRLYVLGNPTKFKQAFMNMIKNSIESIQSNGIVKIEAHAENGMAVIRIADNGEGMDEDQIAKLGEPYYSTKTKGTGLGLMVTFRIIEVMKGTLEFRSEKGKGTEALIRFPLARHH